MKYRLKLSDYTYLMKEFQIVDKKRVPVETEKTVEVRQELYEILRLPGVYRNGIETCDGVALATKIVKANKAIIQIDETDMRILRKVCDKLIAKEHTPMRGTQSLGGERYIELIQRIFRAPEIE